MERISVAEAGRQFEKLIERVSRHGITVELERDNQVVAKVTPCRRVLASDLNRVFASLPTLGDDAEGFAKDVEQIRRDLPKESDPWA
jgi:antitoxin (DNA-binding transcriptional repressor) of toxin-antitoxin stability system